jgi:murein DD-endopeptidase MepM/ murein hydrolase activator NlpD
VQIEPATCPACGAAFDPLRAQAVMVIDGRVRAFCSAACRERGMAPKKPTSPATDAHAAIEIPSSSSGWGSVPKEQKILFAAATIALGALVSLIVAGRHAKATAVAAPKSDPLAGAAAAKAISGAGAGEADVDTWVQPLAGVRRHVTAHERGLFRARDGVPESECGAGRCAIELDAAAGSVVMAVHDGVIELVERGDRGRSVRINHKGGAIASTYLQLDGIREDLKPGIPVRAGDPIGTIERGTRAQLGFALSVRNADGAVLFLDPQPMMALWPIRQSAPMSLHAMDRATDPTSRMR